MTADSISETVADFIKKNFIFDDLRTLGHDESLTGSGIVDSTGILELIAFLEDTYQVKFNKEEFVASNFDSLGKISAFISRKLSQSKS